MSRYSREVMERVYALEPTPFPALVDNRGLTFVFSPDGTLDCQRFPCQADGRDLVVTGVWLRIPPELRCESLMTAQLNVMAQDRREWTTPLWAPHTGTEHGPTGDALAYKPASPITVRREMRFSLGITPLNGDIPGEDRATWEDRRITAALLLMSARAVR